MEYKYNGVILKLEDILKARMHFCELCLGCVQEALERIKESQQGQFVDSVKNYIEHETNEARKYLEGKYDNTFTFLQRAYFLKTGESVPLFKN